MSSSDQAKSKLLDSMRMSKQGSTEVTAPAAAENTATQTPAPKAAAKKPAKTASKKKKTSKTSSKAETKSTAPKSNSSDNFQAAQRVWPD